MSRSSGGGGGGGTFSGVYHAFKEECIRYAKQKLIQVSNNMNQQSKVFNMPHNESGMEQLTSESFGNLLTDIDTFICGADGLLWLREGVILEASSLINILIDNKKEVIILTNDTTKTRTSHEKKLKEHRFSPKVTKDHIVTPGLVAAEYIKNTPSSRGKMVYIIASDGVQDELTNGGIKYFGEGPDLLSHSGAEAVVFSTDLPVKVEDVGAVIVGFDKNFNYKKMMKAANYLKNPKCLFLATNDDATFSCQRKDIIVPDAGAIVAAVSKASTREAIVIGKPHRPVFEYIKKKWDIDETRTMMICSSISSDVKFGNDHGMRTLLVLNESLRLEDLEQIRSAGQVDMLPNYYVTSISALLPSIK